MTLTRLVLTFAFTGIVANLYMKSRRGTGVMSSPSAGAMPAPDDQPSSAVPANATATPAATTAGTESPNAAERLQAQGVARATGEGRPDDQFQSTSQDSPYASSPGLPDFTRGA